MDINKIRSILKSILINIFIFLAFYYLISLYKTKDLISRGEYVDLSNFSFKSIDDKNYNLIDYKDKNIIIYFFSPWCSICKISMANIDKLYQERLGSDKNLEVFFIALDYKDDASIKSLTDKLEIKAPVLLGDRSVSNFFKIKAFPTYYILDSSSKIVARAVGYSSKMGAQISLLMRSM